MNNKEIKTVCAWCDNADITTKELTEQWFLVSHWICEKCKILVLKIMNNENIPWKSSLKV